MARSRPRVHRLQQATNLVSPFGQDVADPPTNDGTHFSVTLSATDKTLYFRLKQ
jgi:hypothetical protein